MVATLVANRSACQLLLGGCDSPATGPVRFRVHRQPEQTRQTPADSSTHHQSASLTAPAVASTSSSGSTADPGDPQRGRQAAHHGPSHPLTPRPGQHKAATTTHPSRSRLTTPIQGSPTELGQTAPTNRSARRDCCSSTKRAVSGAGFLGHSLAPWTNTSSPGMRWSTRGRSAASRQWEHCPVAANCLCATAGGGRTRPSVGRPTGGWVCSGAGWGYARRRHHRRISDA